MGVIKEFVPEIENLSHNDEKIESGKKLINQPSKYFGGLVSELVGEIILQTALDPDKEKNSESHHS